MENSWESRSGKLLQLMESTRRRGALTRIVLSRMLSNLMPASLGGKDATLPNRFDDRRGDRRLHVDRPVTCISDGQGARSARMINISRGGTYVETDSPLDVGQELSLNLLGMNLGPFMRLRARVTRRAEHGMALRFI